MSTDRIEDLLTVYLAARGKPGAPSPEQLCRECPELLPALRKRIAAAEFGDGLLRDTHPTAHDTASYEGEFPARLGGYAVRGVLGRGGMGAVLLAEDTKLGRQVAMKVMLPRMAADPVSRERFVREARAAAAVHHDHVVPIFHVGEEGGVPFLVMPLLPGETLEARIKRDGALPAEEVVRVGREAAEGLAAAHAKGVVHRDVKPANLWLEAPNGRVKLLDFGLARALDGTDGLTAVGAVFGTPAYMAPEQANGRPVDHRADLFSLGVVLYRAATGRPAFVGTSTPAVLLAVTQNEPKPPHAVNPAVPVSLSDLIMRLLAKDPAARPASARAVADELNAVGWGMTAAVNPEQTEEDEYEPPTPPRPRSRRWAVVLAGLAVLLAAAAAILVVRAMTAGGTLVIESDDPNVAVVVKKDGAVVRDATRDREIDLKAGDYTIELVEKKDGVRLSTDKFSITRNGKETVRVTLEKPSVAPKPPDGKPPTPVPPAGSLDALDPTRVPPPARIPGLEKELVGVVGSFERQHWAHVTAAIFQPGGALVVTTGNDGLRTWDTKTFAQVDFIPSTLQAPVTGAIQFSQDGKRFVFGRGGSGCAVVDLSGPKAEIVATLGSGNHFERWLAPDGSRLRVRGFEVRRKVWEYTDYDITAAPPKALATADAPLPRYPGTYPELKGLSVVPLPTSRRAVTYEPLKDAPLSVWDLSGENAVKTGEIPVPPGFVHRHYVNTAGPSDGERIVAFAGTIPTPDKRTRYVLLVSDVGQPVPTDLGTYSLPGNVEMLHAQPGTERLYVLSTDVSRRMVHVFDPAKKSLTELGPIGVNSLLAVSPDGNTVLGTTTPTAMANSLGVAGEFRVYDRVPGGLKERFTERPFGVNVLDATADGKHFAGLLGTNLHAWEVGGQPGTVIRTSCVPGVLAVNRRGPGVVILRREQDPKPVYFAEGFDPHRPNESIFRISTAYQLPQPTAYTESACLDWNGDRLAVPGEAGKAVRVWAIEAGRPRVVADVGTLEARAWVSHVRLSPDNTHVAICTQNLSYKTTGEVWRLTGEKPELVYSTPTNPGSSAPVKIEFLPNSHIFALVNSNLTLVDLARVPTPSVRPMMSSVSRFAVSGSRFAILTGSGLVIGDNFTPGQWKQIRFSHAATQVRFAPDGRHLILSGGMNGWSGPGLVLRLGPRAAPGVGEKK